MKTSHIVSLSLYWSSFCKRIGDNGMRVRIKMRINIIGLIILIIIKLNLFIFILITRRYVALRAPTSS